MQWERARKPEQKAVRREAIIDAARSLFAELEYEEISLNAIAREAGISKPNVYRYFSTREEIFLAIFAVEYEAFLQTLLARLKRIRAKDPVRQISRAWVESATEHRTLLELLPMLMTSMEKNSTVEQLVQFKKWSFEQFGELVEALARVYPRLTTEQWMSVVQSALAMMAGLWPMTNPGENVLEAIQHPEVGQSPWEFEPLLLRGLTALIQGTVLEKKG